MGQVAETVNVCLPKSPLKFYQVLTISAILWPPPLWDFRFDQGRLGTTGRVSMESSGTCARNEREAKNCESIGMGKPTNGPR